jgi:hypothetical protein
MIQKMGPASVMAELGSGPSPAHQNESMYSWMLDRRNAKSNGTDITLMAFAGSVPMMLMFFVSVVMTSSPD